MRQRILLMVLVGIIGAAGYIGSASIMANARLQPGSYREAVKDVLDKAQVRYRDVEVVDGCAPTYQLCRTYAGSVRVLTERTTLAGRIDCRRRWTGCTLTVPAIGLRAVALPDVVDSPPRSLNELWERIEDWFRAVSGQ